MASEKGKRKKESYLRPRVISLDAPDEEFYGRDYKIRDERFYKSLVNFAKDPDSPKIIDETLRFAQEAGLDIQPQVVKPDDPYAHYTHYELLLKGPKGKEHYLTLASEIYEEGYIDEAIAYLDRGSTLLSPTESLEIVQRRDIFEIVKKFIGADELLHESIRKLAHCDSDILIEGETGTGKDVVARLIHTLSKRNKSPFIPFSIAEIPFNLIESELFGHMKGSFTGAINTMEGRFEKAEGGTIFLDEINELRNNVQAKLLRIIQDRNFTKIGSVDSIPLKARIIFGTNESSMDLARKGRMRKDFFYRIFAPSIQLPPLRGRKDFDFEEIVDFFITKSRKKYNREIEMTSAGLKRLYAHNWPGNFRELENLIEAIISTTDDNRIEPYHINQHIKNFDEPGHLLTEATSSWWPEDKLMTTYQDIVLEHCQGKIKEASKILGIDESALRRRLKRKAPRKK